jgi:hypothetical protein
LEIPEIPGIIAPSHEENNAPPRIQNIRPRNGDLIARMEGDRIVRVIPPANQLEITPEIAPPPANDELMLWENLPHAEVPEDLVRLFFRSNAAPLPQHRMGPFNVFDICLERPADWAIDSSEHRFCGEELSQERVGMGFRLRASVCLFCRQEFLLAFPPQNPAVSSPLGKRKASKNDLKQEDLLTAAKNV